MTKLWQHMAQAHGLHLLESEENDIRRAANEDAENERIKLVNEVTQLVAQNLAIKKSARELACYLDEYNKQAGESHEPLYWIACRSLERFHKTIGDAEPANEKS